ncbi:MAG: septum formation initiator family protein [Coriobacteriia bacterium]|nr:septum formation initiator family protein [Coriobacteriia bacterium]
MRTRKPTSVREQVTSSIAHRWWLLPLVVITAVALFIAAYYPVARVDYRETRERARLQAELDAIRSRNDRLSAQVDRLRTPEGVEDYARLQLGMVKSGEHQMVVIDGTETTQVASVALAPEIDSQEAVKPPVGQWTAFLDAVFGVQ